MKRFLFALGIGLLAQTSFAQSVCNPTFTPTMAPQNNNLLRLQVNNTSSYPTGLNKITTFQLHWGDGANTYIGTGNQYHNYASAGNYNVKLVMTVWDSVGSTTVLVCKDSVVTPVTVAHTACATSFSITNNTPNVTVTANNPAGTSGMTYTWNWGDGSPNSTGSPATHNYATNGVKKITLTAVGGSCTYNNDQNVTIGGACGIATASFFTSGTAPTFNFTSTSSVVLGKVRKYDWYFGDGGSVLNASGPNTSHTYTAAGTYTAKLITYWIDSSNNTISCKDSTTKNLTVTNTIAGWIEQDSSSSTAKIDSPEYKVWLIKFDSATNILSAVDSLVANGTNNFYTPYTFNNPANGTYRVKAKLLNGPTSGTGWVPTYHMNSLMWNTATTFVYTGGSALYKKIVMQSGTVTAGPGFIGGNVSAGANKGTGAGIEGLTIILLDANGNMINAATTDANGNYFFSHLPPASYSVYPEELGFATTPSTVSVVNNKPTVTNINFERSNSQKTITPVATAINNVDNYAVEFMVYPNPAKDNITISWNSAVTNAADVTLTDITGKKVYTTTVTGNGNAVLSLGDLQKGFYFITISSNGVHATQKLLLQ